MEPEYVVKVKRWPAFLLGAMLIVLLALLVVVVVFVASVASADRLMPIVALVLVTAGLLVVLALLVWSMLRIITVIRHPVRGRRLAESAQDSKLRTALRRRTIRLSDQQLAGQSAWH